jgi:hypothetical protein
MLGTSPAVLPTVTVVLALVVESPDTVPLLPPTTFVSVAVPPPACVTRIVPPVTSTPPRIELVDAYPELAPFNTKEPCPDFENHPMLCRFTR